MRTAERREVVVQRRLVSQIDDREAQTPSVLVATEKVVVAHADIEQIPWSDALRIVVVVLRPGRRYLDQRRSKRSSRAGCKRRAEGTWRSRSPVARKSALILLIRSHRQSREVVYKQHG